MSNSSDCSSNDLKIKAIGPDNDLILRDLVQLFRHSYEDSFPVQSVYDLQFWKSHIGSRFTSLVALHKGELIGHLGLYPNPDNALHIQACLPACRPDFAPHLPAIGEKLKNLLSDLRSRQSWRLLYFFVLADYSQFHVISGSILGTVETAICPNYFAPTNFRMTGQAKQNACSTGRTHLAITQRMFAPVKRETRTHHVPDYHRSICRRLVDSLGLQRNYASPEESLACLLSRSETPSLEGAVSSDQPALQKSLFARTGVCHTFVQPSLLETPERGLEEIARSSSGNRFVFVNMEDPGCPSFCDALEGSDFRFCGLLPLIQGYDHMIYSNTVDENFDPELFSTPRSRFLANYIRSYTLSPGENRTASNQPLFPPPALLPADGTYGP